MASGDKDYEYLARAYVIYLSSNNLTEYNDLNYKFERYKNRNPKGVSDFVAWVEYLLERNWVTLPSEFDPEDPFTPRTIPKEGKEPTPENAASKSGVDISKAVGILPTAESSFEIPIPPYDSSILPTGDSISSVAPYSMPPPASLTSGTTHPSPESSFEIPIPPYDSSILPTGDSISSVTPSSMPPPASLTSGTTSPATPVPTPPPSSVFGPPAPVGLPARSYKDIEAGKGISESFDWRSIPKPTVYSPSIPPALSGSIPLAPDPPPPSPPVFGSESYSGTYGLSSGGMPVADIPVADKGVLTDPFSALPPGEHPKDPIDVLASGMGGVTTGSSGPIDVNIVSPIPLPVSVWSDFAGSMRGGGSGSGYGKGGVEREPPIKDGLIGGLLEVFARFEKIGSKNINLWDLVKKANAGDPKAAVDLDAELEDRHRIIGKRLLAAGSSFAGAFRNERIGSVASEGFRALGQVGGAIAEIPDPSGTTRVVGLALGAIGVFGEYTLGAIDKLRDFAKSLHDADMRFAEFSGSMAAVRAHQQVRDIELSRARGNRRSIAAEDFARKKHRLEEQIAPIEDAFSNSQKWIGGILIEQVAGPIVVGITEILQYLHIMNKPDNNTLTPGHSDWLKKASERAGIGRPGRF